MDGTRFRLLDLSLLNLSMVSIAAKLWDSQDIKNRIKNYFSGLENRYADYKNWSEISKLVVQYTNSMNLPVSLSLLLKKTILLMGSKIHDWIVYVIRWLELDLIFTEKIYFSFGLVDEIKIFDLYWRDLMAADNFKYESCYFKYSPLMSLACIYGCESFIKEHKNEMLDELNQFYPQIREGDEIYNIMSVSICMSQRKSILGNFPPPQQMFEWCLEAGFSKAARFYWEKLEKVQKVSNLTNFAEKCFDGDGTLFLREKHWGNLLFLINQMGEKETNLFFKNYAQEIILLSLPICQNQELIIDLLKWDWNIESSRLKEMTSCAISSIVYMNGLEFPVNNQNNQLLFQIIQKAWGYMSANEKLQFVEEYLEGPAISMFLTLNLAILNLVLNDPSVKKVHCDIRYNRLMKEGFVELVKIGNFDFLNAIIEKGFNFIPEPKELLKENFSDFFRDLMEKDESFGLVELFLDWSTESEVERAKLKNKINTISVYRSLTESEQPLTLYKFELVENFLKWSFQTDAEIKNFKEGMKS